LSDEALLSPVPGGIAPHIAPPLARTSGCPDRAPR
jgi:hypothetical protein